MTIKKIKFDKSVKYFNEHTPIDGVSNIKGLLETSNTTKPECKSTKKTISKGDRSLI